MHLKRSFISVHFIFLLFVFTIINESNAHASKYSKEANLPKSPEGKIDFRTLEKPFRIHKLNLLWTKAQSRLSEPKLKSLYSDLKLHDKEEVTLKRLKSENMDKDGLHEAQVRKKLISLMDMYGLLEHFEDGKLGKLRSKDINNHNEAHYSKDLFKDKKLNKLWSKAEMAGFTSAELAALREEFSHHQDKIDQYYSILGDTKDPDAVKDDQHENSIDYKLEKFNALDTESEEQQQQQRPNKDYLDKVNLLREQHRELKDGYDRLHRITASGPNSKDFIEPKVQGLWKIALESDFKDDELESLQVELMHYENRLLKLRHLHAEALLHEEKHKEKIDANGSKTNGLNLLQDNIKKHSRKVEKMHYDLETKIMMKHIEL